MGGIPNPQPGEIYRSALQTALGYAVAAALWVLLSDLLLAAFPPSTGWVLWRSVIKGWLFILITATLLYALLRRHADRVLQAERSYRDAVQNAEEQKRQFFRNTIAGITEGKLIVRDPEEIVPLLPPPLCAFTITTPRDAARAREEVRRAALALGITEEQADDLEVAAGEAITNAIKHAQGGEVTLHADGDKILVRVTDHGPGIADLMLPRAVLERGYSTKPSLGMGYTLLLHLTDRIHLCTGPGGTIVILEQHRDSAPRPAPAPQKQANPAPLPTAWV